MVLQEWVEADLVEVRFAALERCQNRATGLHADDPSSPCVRKRDSKGQPGVAQPHHRDPFARCLRQISEIVEAYDIGNAPCVVDEDEFVYLLLAQPRPLPRLVSDLR